MSDRSRKGSGPSYRFAAIMFTDIVGYTALMGNDEGRAIEMLNRNRKLHQVLIAQYHGRLLKEIGDGMLASFDTSTDAVRCASALQNSSTGEGYSLRIGIHQGEVLFKGEDVFGDGVNVASRLQESADAGSTYISGSVYKDIRNKAGIDCEFLGERSLKNVEEPVRAYKVTSEESAIRQDSPVPSGRKKHIRIHRKQIILFVVLIVFTFATLVVLRLFKAERRDPAAVLEQKEKSIAVIPFWNDSPDPDNQYFCNGMEEEIRIQLLKVSDLKVESRQSVEKYRENPDKDIVAIGSELDVSYIVEGSVRKAGDEIRVTVQLIEAATGDHLWGDTYDGNYTLQLLDFQSNMAKEIVSALNAAITPLEANALAENQTQNIEAYDYKIRGDQMWNNFWNTMDQRFLDSAHIYYDLALRLDPGYRVVVARKARTYLDQGIYDSVLVYADRQIALEPAAPGGYNLKGEAYRQMGRIDLAIELMELAASKDPDNLWYNLILSHLYCAMQQNCLKGYEKLQVVFGQDPGKGANVQYYIAWFYLNSGNYDMAEIHSRRSLEYRKTCPGIWCHMLILQAQGRYAEALELGKGSCEEVSCATSWCEFIRISNLLFLKRYEEVLDICNNYEGEGMFDDFIKYGEILAYWKTGEEIRAGQLFTDLVRQPDPEEYDFFSRLYKPYYMTGLYATFGEREKAMDIIEKYPVEVFNDGKIDFLAEDPFYDVLREDEEFRSILETKREQRKEVRRQILEMENQREKEL